MDLMQKINNQLLKIDKYTKEDPGKLPIKDIIGDCKVTADCRTCPMVYQCHAGKIKISTLSKGR